jgi:alpha-mannosidase II
MREREYDKNLPIQGNYYPITAATYIESRSAPLNERDSALSRFTVLSHQAHGVTSLQEGELGTAYGTCISKVNIPTELMLDRRLNRDDGRGLGEPITDNVRTNIPLWLVMETGPSNSVNSFAHPALSLTASEVWHTSNYPLHSILCFFIYCYVQI